MATDATPDEGRITKQRDAGVFLIGIDRPKKLNGFSLAMVRQLAEAFTAMERDDAVRASLASSRRYLEKGPLGMRAEMEALQRELAATADAAEGLRSFVERRKARFTGS
jgi:enoyl-CoA hydratase/carnithine racemase